MGIRLDWEIEADQERVQTVGEDPESARRRRRARLRLLGLLLLMLLIVGGIFGAIALRLRQVDWQIEQLLRDTVDAEVAALRIGDRASFLNVQRSATVEWTQVQAQQFDVYQALKLTRDIRLTGRVLDAAVDGLRGRVRVEEIIDGVPYARLWFYWRYEDGWKHVPPDYTFWGAADTLVAEAVTVRFNEVDRPLAEAMAPELARWIDEGCLAIGCRETPQLRIEIHPDEMLNIGWSPDDRWTLLLPSPYLDRGRVDMPFELTPQIEIANLLAERLFSEAAPVAPVYPADAYYIRQAVISWLVGRFARIETNAFSINSLVENYDVDALARLVANLGTDSNAQIFAAVVGVESLADVNLDWRDLLTWRLTLENDLSAARDEANFLALYDVRDDFIRARAYERFNAVAPTPQPVVVSASRDSDETGTPLLRAVVRYGSGSEASEADVLFRLVDNQWKRVS